MVISSARTSRRAPGLGALAAIALSVGLAACGGGSGSSTNASARAGRGGFLNDPKLAACLKKNGVTIPTRPNGGFRRRPGTGTTPTTARPPAGSTVPNAAQRRRFGQGQGQGGRLRNPAQFQKLRAAIQKCGVKLPSFPGRPGGGPGGPPGTVPTPSATATTKST